MPLRLLSFSSYRPCFPKVVMDSISGIQTTKGHFYPVTDFNFLRICVRKFNREPSPILKIDYSENYRRVWLINQIVNCKSLNGSYGISHRQLFHIINISTLYTNTGWRHVNYSCFCIFRGNKTHFPIISPHSS